MILPDLSKKGNGSKATASIIDFTKWIQSCSEHCYLFVEANLVSLLPITSHNNPNQDFLYYAYIPPKINPFKLFRHVFHCNHFILANQCLKSWKTYQSLLKAGSTVVACVLQCMSINGFALNLKKLITKNYWHDVYVSYVREK